MTKFFSFLKNVFIYRGVIVQEEIPNVPLDDRICKFLRAKKYTIYKNTGTFQIVRQKDLKYSHMGYSLDCNLIYRLGPVYRVEINSRDYTGQAIKLCRLLNKKFNLRAAVVIVGE